jgi:hypothetical protein
MSIVDEARSPPDPNLIRWTGYGLAALGVVAAGFAALAPSPLTAAVGIALPIAPVAVALISPALFEVNVGRWRRSQGFNPLVCAPAFALFLAGIVNDLTDMSLPAIAGAAGAVAGLAAGVYGAAKPGLAAPITLVVTLAVAGGFYGAGAFIVADVRFDNSPARVYEVAVADKHISQGRSTTYYLDLPPWGPRPGSSQVSVSRDFYDATEPGDPVCIGLHPGDLGTPWYVVHHCQAAGPA